MAAQSAPIADGDSMLSSQYDNLRNDVLSETVGHDHSGQSDHGALIPYDDFLAYIFFREDKEK